MATNLNFPSSIIAPSYPLSESLEDNIIRSNFEDGTLKTRPRFTRVRKTFDLTWNSMSNNEKMLLEQFYKGDTRGGALSFNWVHPISKNTHQVRFAEPYEANLTTIDKWSVSIKLQEV